MFAYHALRETLLMAYFVFLREPADSLGMFFQLNPSQTSITRLAGGSFSGRSGDQIRDAGEEEVGRNDASICANIVDRCDSWTEMPGEAKAVQTRATTWDSGSQIKDINVAHKESQTVLSLGPPTASQSGDPHSLERPVNKPLARLSQSVPKSMHASSIIPIAPEWKMAQNVKLAEVGGKSENLPSGQEMEDVESDVGLEAGGSEKNLREVETRTGGLPGQSSIYNIPEISDSMKRGSSVQAGERGGGSVKGQASWTSYMTSTNEEYPRPRETAGISSGSVTGVTGKRISPKPSTTNCFFMDFFNWLEEGASTGLHNFYLVLFLIISLIVLLHAGIFSYHQSALESARKRGIEGVTEPGEGLLGFQGTEGKDRSVVYGKEKCGNDLCAHREFSQGIADPEQLHTCQFLSSYLLA